MEILKKIWLIIFVLCFFQGINQDIESDDNANKELPNYPYENGKLLKIGAISYVIGRVPFSSEYRLVYEFLHQPKVSSEIAVSYLGINYLMRGGMNGTSGAQTPYLNGFRVQLAEKFYWNIFGNAPKGMYSGLHISYASAKFSSPAAMSYGIYYTAEVLSINFRQGIQLRYKQRYYMDSFFLLGYKEIQQIEYSPFSNPKIQDHFDDYTWLEHVNVLVGFNVGFNL